ncbi:MAG: Tim44 domain-containing protein [Alphaproteobacteria bacterium]|nr:Tim44 domain-containing protein [Alphaproteobacteria bacterium]
MEGFQYGDIIVIGAIAAFVILRYRSMLGSDAGRDPSEIQRTQQERQKAAAAAMEPIVKLVEREAAKKAEQPETSYPEMLAISFKQMRNIDAEFSPEDFVTGAKMAFEMVIKAFNERDHETLKMLLASDVYENFNEAIETQKQQNVTHQTTLVAINKADITHATLHGKKARITVKFDSEQIHVVRDASGAISQGNPSDIDLMDDEWVFERDLTSSSPNWMVVET